MKKQLIRERLNFGFTLEEFSEVQEMAKNYFEDMSGYLLLVKDDESFLPFYKEYFINLPNVDNEGSSPIILKDCQKAHLLLTNFLNTNYEIFTLPQIQDEYTSLIKLVSPYTYTSFDNEVERLEELFSAWERFSNFLCNNEILDLDDYTFLIQSNCQIFYHESTSLFILNTVKDFLSNLLEAFPRALLRLDRIVITTPQYLEWSCDDSTFAYFLDDTLFLPSNVKEENNNFFIETIWHEFGHFLYEELSELGKMKWNENYNYILIDSPELKDEIINEFELFADCFADMYSPVQDTIQPIDDSILDVCDYILINYLPHV